MCFFKELEQLKEKMLKKEEAFMEVIDSANKVIINYNY